MKDKKMFVLSVMFIITMLMMIVFTLVVRIDINEVKKEIISIFAYEIIERKDMGKCGNPTNAFTRVVCGEVTAIDEYNHIIELTDEDGEIWTTEVGYASEFDLNDYYCIFFDTMGTDTIYDDEVVKLWKEVW